MITLSVCALGTKSLRKRNYSQGKRWSRVLGKIYRDAKKHGYSKCIERVMEILDSKLTGEDKDAFQAFKDLFTKRIRNKNKKGDKPNGR